MAVFLAIGFHYLDGFPGLLDLAGVKKIFSCPNQIVTITDFGKEDSSKIHQLVDKIGGLENFYSEVCLWEHYHVAKDTDSLTAILRQHQNKKVILYYSGHGTEEGMVLPSNEIFPWFKIIQVLQPEKFYGIFDCCYAPNFAVPFEYKIIQQPEKDHYSSLSMGKWMFNDNWNFNPQIRLVFAACSPEEKILTHGSLSLFTKIFGQWWVNDKSFSHLLELFPTGKIWTSNPWPEEQLLTEWQELLTEISLTSDKSPGWKF